jgi:peptidoglycan-associated lipoprotein
MHMLKVVRLLGIVLVLALVVSCAKRGTAGSPAPAPELPPSVADTAPASARPPTPPPPPTSERVEETVPVVPVAVDDILTRTLDELNRDSPLGPVFFGLDQAELDDGGRAVAAANADIMKKYPTWVVTIEGHADERGTAEYNLALGERRAQAVRTYLLSLGIAPHRLRTISYGKEFPFDAGHDEAAWARNRRGHFVITEK